MIVGAAPVPPGYRDAHWAFGDDGRWRLIGTTAHGTEELGSWTPEQAGQGATGAWLNQRAAGLPCDCCGDDPRSRDGWRLIDGAPYCAHCSTDEGCSVSRITERLRH